MSSTGISVPAPDPGSDAALERYAVGDVEGNVRVHRIADGREIVRLPRGGGPCLRLDFSPDGRYLSAVYAVPGHGSNILWDIGGGGAPRKVMESALF